MLPNNQLKNSFSNSHAKVLVEILDIENNMD